jgi:hypothetical protein
MKPEEIRAGTRHYWEASLGRGLLVFCGLLAAMGAVAHLGRPPRSVLPLAIRNIALALSPPSVEWHNRHRNIVV